MTDTVLAALIAGGAGLAAGIGGGLVGAITTLKATAEQRKAEIERARLNVGFQVLLSRHENRKGAYVPILEMCSKLKTGEMRGRAIADIEEIVRYRVLLQLLGSEVTQAAYENFLEAYERRAETLEANYDTLCNAMRRDLNETIGG